MFSDSFRANLVGAYGSDAEDWLASLPSLITSLSELWQFTDLKLIADLNFHFVAGVTLRDGRVAVLKMGPPQANLVREVIWLRGHSAAKPIGLAPELYEFDKERNAILMERCLPGRALISHPDDNGSTEILARVIQQLRAAAFHPPMPSSDSPYRHVSSLADDLEALTGKVPPRLLTAAQEIFTDLTQDHSSDILLHGDLHHGNVLGSTLPNGAKMWKVVDPHGYIGHPTAETGVLLYNPIQGFPTDRPVEKVLAERIRILSEVLGDPAEMIARWGFARAMLSIAWNVQDQKEQAKIDLRIIEALYSRISI